MSANTAGYAGDVLPQEAWDKLRTEVDAVLVDVRTAGEWSYVGLPRLDGVGKTPLLVEWRGGQPEDFVQRLKAELTGMGVTNETPLYFICRSGSRSRNAAVAMTAAGHRQCFNISTGFEGPLDAEGHRGRKAGWKVDGLPWIQS